MILEIKSSRWLRGTGSNLSSLWDGEQGCCLGLHGEACGIPLPSMYGVGSPWSFLSEAYDNASERILYPEYFDAWIDPQIVDEEFPSSLKANEAMRINDNRRTTDEEKIALLVPLFSSIGVEIIWLPDE